MAFTPEHVTILEQHSKHWETLSQGGYMANLDAQSFEALQRVHNEALSSAHFTRWCSACVADMVRTIYTAYERHLEQSTKTDGNVQQTTTNKGRGRKRTVLGAQQ